MTKYGSWEPRGDWTDAEITESRRDAAIEFRNSTLGQQLFVRGGADIFDRVIEEFGKRAQPPSVVPFYETLEQAARDILLTLPAEPEPEIPSEPVPEALSPADVQRVKDAQAARDAARDQRTSDLNSFAHIVNAAIAHGGIDCLRPKNGFIRLKFEKKGKPYEYKYKYTDGSGKFDGNGNLLTSAQYDEFMRNFEEACARGLIDR